MSDITLEDGDIERLKGLADVLIPGTATLSAPSALSNFERLLRSAVKACGYPDVDLRSALDAIPPNADWDSTRAFATANQAGFDIVSVIVSGAYFMSPVVLGALGYPLERRHPAGPEEFADEYETGILDPVINRGPRFRDPR